MSSAYALTVILMVAFPLLLAVALRRRFRTLWILWTAGALAFFLSQIYHLPLNNWLADIGLIGSIGPDAPNLLRTSIVLGLSAALSEGLMRLVTFWFLNRHRLVPNWQDGVMVGLGHGGTEAMILGAMTALSVAALLGLRETDLSTLNLSAEQLTQLTRQLDLLSGSPLMAAMPLFERVVAISLHVAVSLLFWLAFRLRQPLYIVVGILYHATLDATIVYAGQFIDNVWLLEGLVFLLALPGIAFIWWAYRRYGADQATHRPPPWGLEWRQWATMTRKELIEQWRTWKVLVIGAVFILFGLASPLLARFTSEILMSVPGAEEFADLIPVPTTADAINQYLKNLTQFGFIIAILAGMGAIAGERDRGTAAMILSKPVPRWAFVSSKFTAQALVYLLALVLAGLSALLYTNLLFDPPLLAGPFLWGTILLWVWLLAFVAVTLLGSSIGRSVLIAAGLALLGSVILLIAGSFPQAATLLPSGLIAWISQLGLPDPAPVNGWGALVGTVVLILFCLVTAVGVVERQEI
jgi:ABC-2 type transport system permease protein